MERILVTGANGFVGKNLVNYLGSIDHNVTPVVRQDIGGDIGPGTNWSKFLEEIDVVIHLAARVHIINDQAADPWTEFHKVNTLGSVKLFEDAVKAGVKRFIYLSTIKVNGDKTTTIPFRETDTPNPKDFYSQSKYEAELALIKLAKQSDVELVIIRPPLVYGPGVKANFEKIMRWVSKGIPLPLASIHNKRSLVAIENLVDFITVCVDHPDAAHQVFLVSDDEDISTTELFQRVGYTLGKSARLFAVPTSFIMAVSSLFGKRLFAERLCSSLQVDISKAKELLGWYPPYTVKVGLNKTVTWFLDNV